jgi:Ca2+-binding RTX toxin-like protein
MRRILLLVTVASMLAAAMALSGVAQAAPTIGSTADAKCLAEAAQTVEQPGFKPADYTFHGGTELNDNFTDLGTDNVPDVFCGFGDDDQIGTLDEGDIFLGGAGNDFVFDNNGTFYGQEGDDDVVATNTGTVFGGAGNDFVFFNGGTFYGEEGNDGVEVNGGTFDGGDGTDFVTNDFGGCTRNVELGGVGSPC